MKKELLIFILLLLFTFPAVKSLFQPGGFTSHDLTHHVVRQIDIDELLSEGQFPPRWSGGLNNGFGYPVFIFIYPLPALIGEVFHKLGLGYVTAVKAVLFTSMILSVLGMYLFLKELLGSKLAAFLGSIFYLYAPIRFLNVYVSAAAGSALAAGIIPFVFLSLVLIKKGKKWAILIGGTSLAGLILAHNVTTLIFAPVLLVFTTFLIWRVREIKVIKNIGVMFLLGLGLSAWFWLPAIFEKQFIQFDQIYQNFYQAQFVSLGQLIHSPWGYGLSHPQNPENGDMSYQLGLIHIGVIMVYGIWYLVYGRKSKSTKILGLLVLTGFILSILMMLKISQPVWEALPFLSLIQFPLRFQALSIFAVSLAAALLIKWIPAYAGMTIRSLVFISLLVLVIFANRNHWYVNQVFDPGEKYYLSLKTTTASFDEHLPKWGRRMDKLSPGKLEFISGSGQIKLIKDQSAQVLAETETTSSAKLRFNQFYFPGWEIKIDEKKVNFDYLTGGESYGLPVFDLEAGKHQIKAEFRNTSDRGIADFISLISMVLWLALLCKLLAPNLFKIKKSS